MNVFGWWCVKTKIILDSESKKVPRAKAAREDREGIRASSSDPIKLDVQGQTIPIAATTKDPRAGWKETFRGAHSKRVKENLWNRIPLDEGWDN